MLEMKIFLQVFSETLSVHFCAPCEHNVKHNNLSPAVRVRLNRVTGDVY